MSTRGISIWRSPRPTTSPTCARRRLTAKTQNAASGLCQGSPRPSVGGSRRSRRTARGTGGRAWRAVRAWRGRALCAAGRSMICASGSGGVRRCLLHCTVARARRGPEARLARRVDPGSDRDDALAGTRRRARRAGVIRAGAPASVRARAARRRMGRGVAAARRVGRVLRRGVADVSRCTSAAARCWPPGGAFRRGRAVGREGDRGRGRPRGPLGLARGAAGSWDRGVARAGSGTGG